jgi:hypothetical protein
MFHWLKEKVEKTIVNCVCNYRKLHLPGRWLSGSPIICIGLFLKKNSIILIFCISRWLAVPINLDNWSSIVDVILLIIFKTTGNCHSDRYSLMSEAALPCFLIRVVQDVQLKSGPYFNLSNLFTNTLLLHN